MALVLNGDGAIAGLAAGGLPDASITQSDLASGVAGNGPVFMATVNLSNQSISSVTTTKLLCYTTELVDTANCYNTTTNRFTPNVAGYYQINGACQAATDWCNGQLMIYKNGIIEAVGYRTNNGVDAVGCFTVNSLVYFNGTTDYIEFYMYWNKTQYTGTIPSQGYINGALLRAA
jgi:hypothetical protein